MTSYKAERDQLFLDVQEAGRQLNEQDRQIESLKSVLKDTRNDLLLFIVGESLELPPFHPAQRTIGKIDAALKREHG